MFHSSLERLAPEFDLHVEFKAFELTPREAGITPEQWEAKRVMIEKGWPRLQEMARNTWGLHLQRGPLGIDTRLAHVGAKVAERHGRGPAFHKAAFEAYWLRGEDLSDIDVLVRVATSIGLAEEAFRAGLDDPTLWEAVKAEAAEAHRLGITGVPATVINRKHLLPGCLPPAELARVLERVGTGR